jgi:hypothetical protein
MPDITKQEEKGVKVMYREIFNKLEMMRNDVQIAILQIQAIARLSMDSAELHSSKPEPDYDIYSIFSVIDHLAERAMNLNEELEVAIREFHRDVDPEYFSIPPEVKESIEKHLKSENLMEPVHQES